MSYTLAELLTPRNRPTLEAMLMAVLQETTIEGMPGVRFPVTDWQPGGFERTHMKMIATGLLDREDTIRMITAGGFLDLASTLEDADGNPIEGWMELLASKWYLLNRYEAGYSRQLLTLTCTSGPGPYTRAAGEIIAMSPVTGNRYTNEAEVTIPDGGSVTAIFKAEGPGIAWADSAETIVVLVTPGLPGVTVTNAPSVAGVPANYISGSGSLAVTSTTVTTTPRTVKIAFTAAGRVSDSSARFTCTVYQGQAVTTTGPFVASASFSQGDLTIGFTDGATGTQSFDEGDEWIVGVPGTPLLQAGSDKEQLSALAQRCRDRWPSLSLVPTGNRFAGMVRECQSASKIGITKVTTRASTTVAGVENVYIAGPTATATPTQVAAVQAYVDERSSDVDMANVIAAEDAPISLGGTVKCRRGTIDTIKANANLAWQTYIAGLDLGGEPPDGLVKLLALENILNDAGAYNATGLTLNGSAADVVLTGLQCASVAAWPNGLPSDALTWHEVA